MKVCMNISLIDEVQQLIVKSNDKEINKNTPKFSREKVVCNRNIKIHCEQKNFTQTKFEETQN